MSGHLLTRGYSKDLVGESLNILEGINEVYFHLLVKLKYFGAFDF